VAGAPREGGRGTGASAAGSARYVCGAQASSRRSGFFPESTWGVSHLRLVHEEQRGGAAGPVFSSREEGGQVGEGYIEEIEPVISLHGGIDP
jgi:hypothetical protein